MLRATGCVDWHLAQRYRDPFRKTKTLASGKLRRKLFRSTMRTLTSYSVYLPEWLKEGQGWPNWKFICIQQKLSPPVAVEMFSRASEVFSLARSRSCFCSSLFDV